jgi:hypothetical protein
LGHCFLSLFKRTNKIVVQAGTAVVGYWLGNFLVFHVENRKLTTHVVVEWYLRSFFQKQNDISNLHCFFTIFVTHHPIRLAYQPPAKRTRCMFVKILM